MDDAIRNAIIALTSMVPTIGGTVSFILDKYIPSEAERRKNLFLQQMANDIEMLKEKVDIKNLETPEFQSVFVRLLRASIEEYRAEKLTAFRNIALNLLTDTSQFNFDRADFYSRMTLTLISDEIKILHVFYRLDVKGELDNYDKKAEPRDVYSIIDKLWDNVDREYIKALMMDCMRYMLISGSPGQQKVYKRKGIFLTELGRGFVEYIFNPIEGNFYEQRQ